ncbi:MAG: SIMPL domain-containing protein [Candidatus Binatia bacterium]
MRRAAPNRAPGGRRATLRDGVLRRHALVLPQPRLPPRLARAQRRDLSIAPASQSGWSRGRRVAAPTAVAYPRSHDATARRSRPARPGRSGGRQRRAAAAHHRRHDGRVSVALDLAIVSFGVETTAPTAGAAVAENAKKSTALVAAIANGSAPGTKSRRRSTP